MHRRLFLGGITGLIGSSICDAAPKGSILELRRYRMRNSSEQQMQRTSEFIEKHAIPAGKRAGGVVAGVFANSVSPGGPFVLMVNQYKSLAAMEESQEKLAADKEFMGALESYYAGPLGYERVEVSLLRAFDSIPTAEAPPIEEGKAPRVFELRVYESNTPASLKRKIAMFEGGGEMGIFRRVGIRPVFFGSALAGPNLPNLTYMVCYDNLAAREAAWKAFLADPEWQKLRATPGLGDAELVSNIGNEFLRPLPFSAIR
ncbi:MAG: NIPSNAP family protein [Bryobacteraceae bacterium]